MSFSIDHELVADLEVVVRAITAGLEKSYQRQMDENLETNNWMLLGRADYINNMLHQMVLKDGFELIPFKRYFWKGRILLNRRHKAAIIIMTENRLRDLIRKIQQHQSLLHYSLFFQFTLNSGLPAKDEQISLFSDDSFDEQGCVDVFNSIVNGNFDPAEGFINYFITYTTERGHVIDVKLKLFNSKFELVDEMSLNHFLKPNFANLTSPVETIELQNEDDHNKATRGLSKLKLGIKPSLREEEDLA